MNKLLYACTPLALTCFLSACTGTDEPPAPARLVTLEDAATLRVTDVGSSAAGGAVTAPAPVIGIATVASGAKLAVAYADKLEFRDADLNVLSSFSTTFLPPGGTPCFAKLASDSGGARLALFSACSGQPDAVALFDSVGALRYQVFLPGVPANLTFPNATLGLAVVNDNVWVARPSADPTRSEVLRVTPAVSCDTTLPVPAACVPNVVSLTPAPGYTPKVNDLAATASNVYAATDAGLFTLPAGAGSLTATVLTGKVSRVWAQQGVLAAWNADSGLLTIAGARSLNVSSTQTVIGLRDLTVTQDGYLYALQAGGISCYDVVRPNFSATCPAEASTNVSLNGGRMIAWVVSQALAQP